MLRDRFPVHSTYLDAIRGFEGFTAKADWDYAQFTNGYGTRARFAGEVIDKAEADRRFASEISQARAIVEKHAPDAAEGTKAALTSLTFNAGTAWTKSGLGDAVRTGDVDRMREIFVQYNKAGGEVLPGLVRRRLAEAAWIGAPQAPDLAAGGGVAGAAVATSVVAGFTPEPVAVTADAGGSGPSFAAPTLAAREAQVAATVRPLRLAETPVPLSSGDTAESGEAVRLATSVSGFAGEARLTQLLLASELVGGASSRKDEDGTERGET